MKKETLIAELNDLLVLWRGAAKANKDVSNTGSGDLLYQTAHARTKAFERCIKDLEKILKET